MKTCIKICIIVNKSAQKQRVMSENKEKRERPTAQITFRVTPSERKMIDAIKQQQGYTNYYQVFMGSLKQWQKLGYYVPDMSKGEVVEK